MRKKLHRGRVAAAVFKQRAGACSLEAPTPRKVHLEGY